MRWFQSDESELLSMVPGRGKHASQIEVSRQSGPGVSRVFLAYRLSSHEHPTVKLGFPASVEMILPFSAAGRLSDIEEHL